MKSIILDNNLNKPYNTTTLSKETKKVHNQKPIVHNLDYLQELANRSKPLFSYYVSADQYITIKDYYIIKATEARQNVKSWQQTKVIKSKDGIHLIDYNARLLRDKNEEINYKNSFLEMSNETIENACPILVTITLPSLYHVGDKNPMLHKIKDPETLQDKIEFIHYKGYKKIVQFNRRLYKNKVFKKGKLDKNNRSSITALEPHKDWTPHQHQLQFINANHFVEYIKTFVHTALDEQLGRTQLVITKDKLEIVKNMYDLEIKFDKMGREEYFIKDTYIFFQEFQIKDGNELKSVSNYLTSYIETKHIVEPLNNDSEEDKNKKKKNKKVVLEYDGWAYYLADLKDKYEKNEYGKKHKKIRRINYTQLLISRAIYKRVMNKKFIEYLASINELDTKNMYYKATKMLQRNELKVYKYHEVFYRADDVVKYEKHNINYIGMLYKDYDDLIDCKSFDIIDFSQDGQMKVIHESKQIDLGKDDFIIKQYKLVTDGTKEVFDVAI